MANEPPFKPKTKTDILHEMLEGRFVGGTLSQLANYSELFLKMSEAVFLLDRHSFRVMECNPAACTLLKRDESEILGQEFPTFMPEEKEHLERSLKSTEKSKWSLELELKDKKGSPVFFEVSATMLKILDYIEVIQFIAKDVTEMKLAQRELREMNTVLRNLSTTDEMTGLRNYRYFKEALASVHHHAQNFKEQYGIIFIDVDHFKKFNDRNGHPAGDDALRRVASILKSTARSQDLPVRYGGEEFVVLCRHSTVEETRAQAELIRHKIASTSFPFGEFQPLGLMSASIGVSGFPLNGDNFETVLEAADQALYLSKEGGRNQVSQLDEPPAAQATKPGKKIA